MAEQQINLLSFYKGWDAYQALLIKAVAPLSSEELTLRVVPHLRSVGENVAHIIRGRVSNFLVLGEAGAEMAPLETWDERGAPRRSAAELISGLESTWQMIQMALVRWTPADLADVFVDGQGEQASRFTRQSIIWSTIKHDLHHGGEISHAWRAPCRGTRSLMQFFQSCIYQAAPAILNMRMLDYSPGKPTPNTVCSLRWVRTAFFGIVLAFGFFHLES